MELAWYALLGLFFATYLVLGGYDYGVGLLLARGTDPARRRAALTALGPFFLGNEVWLVAAVGILFGAFPTLEGELLSGFYPAVVGALVGVILVTAGVQLRSRPTAEATRARWDRVVVAGSALAALGWGALLGGLLQGVPRHADGHVAGVTHLATPFAAAAALAMLALVAVHGATFLTLRLPAADAAAVGRLARRLVRWRSPRSPRPPSWACSPTGYAPPRRARCSPYSCRYRWSRRCWWRGRRCAGGGPAWPSPPPAWRWRCRWRWSGRPCGPRCWSPPSTRPPRSASPTRRPAARRCGCWAG